MVAGKIVEVAQGGERDPHRIRDLTLRKFGIKSDPSGHGA
jgi:hypothetical protein